MSHNSFIYTDLCDIIGPKWKNLEIVKPLGSLENIEIRNEIIVQI